MLEKKLWLLLILLLGCVSFQNLKAEEDPEVVKKKLSTIQSVLDKLKTNIFTHKKLELEHHSEIVQMDEEIKLKNNALDRLQHEITQREEKLKTLDKAQETINQHLEKQQEILAKQLRMMVGLQQNNTLKMLFNLQTPQALDRLLRYFPFLKSYYIHSIQDTSSHLAELQKNKIAIEEEKVALTQLIIKQKKEIAAVQLLKNKRLALLETIQNQIAVDQKKLRLIQAEEQNLSERLKVLDQTLSQLPPPGPAWRSFSGSKGRLTFPILGPKAELIKASLPSTSAGNPVMINAEPGQEVRSIYYGRVVFAETLRGFGLLLIIDHGGGYMSLYGHNQELYKKVGDLVQAGQLIGRVTQASELENSSLYFEIRKNGKPINLVGWFK